MKNRRKACAHLYSEEAVRGLDGYRDATEEEKAEYLEQHGHAHSTKVHEYYSLDSPKPGGNFAAAAAAFLRLHERREEQLKVKDWEKRVTAAGSWYGENVTTRAELTEGQTHLLVEHWVPKAHLLTKYKALLADLEALREEEPNMRVVIFTEYDEVQERLVDMLRSKVSKSGGGGSSRSAAGSRSSAGSGTGLSSSASGSAGTRSSRLAARSSAAGASDSPTETAGGSDSHDGAADASGSPAGSTGVSCSPAGGAADGAPLLGPDDLDGGEGGDTAADGEEGGTKDGAAAGAGLSGLQLFEFNAKTAPVARHKRIKDFQGGGDDGAKIFVVTYRTAAVGITLTAANRVYLFEPALDPAQEVQAAGRIHRLGQTKEVTSRHSNLGPTDLQIS